MRLELERGAVTHTPRLWFDGHPAAGTLPIVRLAAALLQLGGQSTLVRR